MSDTYTLLKISPSAEAWCAHAEALMHVGQVAKAEAAATKAIEINGKLKAAFQIRGEARYILKSYKQSASDFHSFGVLDRVQSKAEPGALSFTTPSYSIWKSNRDRPY